MKLNPIKRMKVNDLQEWGKNPRKIQDYKFEELKKRIQDIGFNDILKVAADGKTVIGGNHRLRALKALGVDEVDVMLTEAKDEGEMLRIALSDNQEFAEYDTAALRLQLAEHKDLDLTGYEIALGGGHSVMDYFNVTEKDDVEDGFDAAAEVEQIDTPVSRRGEVYRLGKHKLMCGDSTCEEDYQKLLGNEKANLVFTDPPYMVDYHSSSKAKKFSSSNDKVDGSNIYNDNLDDDGAIEFYRKVLERLYEHTTDDAPIYWWYAANKQMLNEIAFKNTGWYHSQNVIWVKTHFVFAMGQDFHRQHEPAMFGWKKGNKHFKARKLNNLSDTFTLSKDEFGDLLDVWIEDRDKQTDYIHPTQKPIALPIRGIRVSSKPGDIVIDAFGGSGSTLMACERMGRRARIMELDPKFCDAIRKRYTRFMNGSDEGWEAYTPAI